MDNWIPVASVALAVIFVAVLVAWIGQARRVLSLIRARPDEAYDFFASHSENWTMFEVSASALQPDQVPVLPGAPGGKALGPFEFEVPKLGGRTVCVFGTTRESLRELDEFEAQVRRKE